MITTYAYDPLYGMATADDIETVENKTMKGP